MDSGWKMSRTYLLSPLAYCRLSIVRDFSNTGSALCGYCVIQRTCLACVYTSPLLHNCVKRSSENLINEWVPVGIAFCLINRTCALVHIATKPSGFIYVWEQFLPGEPLIEEQQYPKCVKMRCITSCLYLAPH